VKKIQNKFLLASIKSLTNCKKILPVTLFRELVPAFRYPRVILKVDRKPPVILEIFPKAGHERTCITPKNIDQ
jgi:hypothetical protein